MNFNPYANYCYQFWMVPNMMSTPAPYYAPVVVYPQLVQPRPNNLIINANYVDSHSNLIEVKEKIQAKNESKAAVDEATHKSENEKITVQIDSSISKQPSLKIEPKKAKRPQTYLTEKAFYMKQKLKGKQKGSARILRRRLKIKQIKTTRVIQAQKNLKKTGEHLKVEKKKLPIVKNSQKERKIMNKIKLKLLKQYRDEFAEIPKKISGVVELNEFCRTKLQNLLSRQVTTQ